MEDFTHNRDFYRLIDAVIDTPWIVKEMIEEEPRLVEATNLSGETVIHWFIVENELEKVALLHDCGAPIDPYALTEACALGHPEMCELLLCYGIQPNIPDCLRNIELHDRMRTRRAKRIRIKINEIFRKHGYPLTMTV